ncbi:MAG: class I SAM-dependent methyltransferase [Candidatus Marinimicrobia bacterium]|nr:class I SAM-dependent methyltransferase [Candidatus Neomarinimicrobiota bacterium]
MKKRATISDLDNVMLECGMQCLHPGGLETTDKMLRECGIAEDKKVLELGCGKGLTAAHIAEKYNCRVTGIDHSQDMIAEARIRAKRLGLHERLHFLRSGVIPLPFPEDSYDIIIAECVTTLLETEKIFPEILRVLKPGGKMGDIEIIWRQRPPIKVIRGVRNLWDGFHTFTLKEWKTLLTKSGFPPPHTVDFSMPLSEMESNMVKTLGTRG